MSDNPTRTGVDEEQGTLVRCLDGGTHTWSQRGSVCTKCGYLLRPVNGAEVVQRIAEDDLKCAIMVGLCDHMPPAAQKIRAQLVAANEAARAKREMELMCATPGKLPRVSPGGRKAIQECADKVAKAIKECAEKVVEESVEKFALTENPTKKKTPGGQEEGNSAAQEFSTSSLFVGPPRFMNPKKNPRVLGPDAYELVKPLGWKEGDDEKEGKDV